MANLRHKICIISPGATPIFFPEIEGTHGGSEAQLAMVAQALANLEDFEVHFIVHSEAARPSAVREGVTVHFAPMVRGLGAKLKLQKLLFAINADIYLQQGIGSITKEIAFYCLWRRKIFVYWIAHDKDVDPSVSSPGSSRNKWFEWGMLRADLTISQTTMQQSALKQNFGRDSIILHSAFPFREPAGQERKTILWVGRFTEFKRPECFIKLAQSIPEQHFLMIGSVGNDSSAQLFEKHRAELEATANLEYCPGVPFEEIHTYFDQAKIFVNTSFSEGYPNTFVHAMWAKTPIASLIFAADGIIADKRLGVAPTDGDLEKFSAELNNLLNDPAQLASCAENAYAYACEHHNLARNAELLARHLRELP